MNTANSRIDHRKLERALGDIREHITESAVWKSAMQHLSSIRDYSYSDLRSCDGPAALEHCDALKRSFPAETTPEKVFQNLDAIAAEIAQIEEEETSESSSGFLTALVVILVVFGLLAYWLYRTM